MPFRCRGGGAYISTHLSYLLLLIYLSVTGVFQFAKELEYSGVSFPKYFGLFWNFLELVRYVLVMNILHSNENELRRSYYGTR